MIGRFFCAVSSCVVLILSVLDAKPDTFDWVGSYGLRCDKVCGNGMTAVWAERDPASGETDWVCGIPLTAFDRIVGRTSQPVRTPRNTDDRLCRTSNGGSMSLEAEKFECLCVKQ